MWARSAASTDLPHNSSNEVQGHENFVGRRSHTMSIMLAHRWARGGSVLGLAGLLALSLPPLTPLRAALRAGEWDGWRQYVIGRSAARLAKDGGGLARQAMAPATTSGAGRRDGLQRRRSRP